MICYMGVNTDIETHSNSKDAAGKTDRTALATYQQTSSMTDGFNDSNSSDPWSRMYAIVEQANLVIKGIKTLEIRQKKIKWEPYLRSIDSSCYGLQ